jgi:hypothetical protein
VLGHKTQGSALGQRRRTALDSRLVETVAGRAKPRMLLQKLSRRFILSFDPASIQDIHRASVV